MQGMESFGVEGEYKPLEFVSSSSDQLWNGLLHKEQNTVGVIFVADKRITTGRLAGARDVLSFDNGETAVMIYSCELIQVPKAAGVAIAVGDAIYWDGIHLNGVSNVWQSGWLWIGICKFTAVAGADHVRIDLHGQHPLAEEAP